MFSVNIHGAEKTQSQPKSLTAGEKQTQRIDIDQLVILTCPED